MQEASGDVSPRRAAKSRGKVKAKFASSGSSGPSGAIRLTASAVEVEDSDRSSFGDSVQARAEKAAHAARAKRGRPGLRKKDPQQPPSPSSSTSRAKVGLVAGSGMLA